MDGTWGFGNFNSPLRNEYTAYTAIGLNKYELAFDRLKALSNYYIKEYEKQKYPYFIQRKKVIDNEIEKLRLTMTQKIL